MIRISFSLLLLLLLFHLPARSQTWEELNKIASEYYKQGNLTKAIEYEAKALKKAEMDFGKEHFYYGLSSLSLGLYYSVASDYENSKKYYPAGLEIIKRELGAKDKRYLTSLYNFL